MTKVLLVDDEEAVRDTMVDLLGMYQLDVSAASSGPEAIDRARLSRFDVIVMDINMKEMNGFETYRRLRESGVTAPVIVLTGRPESPEAHELRGECGVTVIGKPPEIDELLEQIRRAHATQ